MSKHIVFAAAALALAASFAGATADARTKIAVMSSSTIAVAPGSTWAWAPSTTSFDPRVANDIMQERIQTAVQTSMAAHGLRQVVAPPMAALLVSYHVRLENRIEPRVNQSYGSACGFRGCVRGFGPATVDIARYTEGTLVIDIVDAKTGRLLWRAASDKRVSQKDATQAKLNKVVADMTKSLPMA